MRKASFAFAVVAVILAMAGTASAQAPFVSKPIDTDKYLIRPSAAIGNATGQATNGIIRTAAITVANTIEDNGFVRTFNNVLGRRAQPTPNQAGYSALPMASSYQSMKYRNSFVPFSPVASTFGKSPNIR